MGFRRCLSGALADYLDKPGFDVVEGHGFDEGIDVDLLGFEEVGDICQAVKSTELRDKVSKGIKIKGTKNRKKLTSPAHTYCMFATL